MSKIAIKKLLPQLDIDKRISGDALLYIADSINPMIKHYRDMLVNATSEEDLVSDAFRLPGIISEIAILRGSDALRGVKEFDGFSESFPNAYDENLVPFANGVLDEIARQFLLSGVSRTKARGGDIILVKDLEAGIERNPSLKEYVEHFLGLGVGKKQVRRVVKKASKGLESMTVPELRKKAKAKGLTGYSKMKKAELLKALQGSKKASRKGSKKASRKGSKKAGKKASRKGSKKAGKKASRKAVKKSSRKGAKKASRKAVKKSSRKGAKKASRKGSKKAGKKASRKGAKPRGFAGMTVTELKAKAKVKGLKGYSRMTKDQLIKQLRK